MEYKYPTRGTIAIDSIVSMFKGYLIQLAMIVIFGIIKAILDQSVYEFVFLLIFWTFYSGLVIVVGWLIVYLPFYILTYQADWLYAKRRTAIYLGTVVGFIVPFGVIALWGIDRYDWYGLGSCFFCGIFAAITGGTAGEVGYRLRRKALRELNPDYDKQRERKTGPLKVLSEI